MSVTEISEDQYATSYYFCDLKVEDEETDPSCECELSGGFDFASPNCPECKVAQKRHKENDDWDRQYGGYHTVICQECGETKQARRNVLGTTCPKCKGVMKPEEEPTLEN